MIEDETIIEQRIVLIALHHTLVGQLHNFNVAHDVSLFGTLWNNEGDTVDTCHNQSFSEFF